MGRIVKKCKHCNGKGNIGKYVDFLVVTNDGRLINDPSSIEGAIEDALEWIMYEDANKMKIKRGDTQKTLLTIEIKDEIIMNIWHNREG